MTQHPDEVISVHKTRREARKRERQVQMVLDQAYADDADPVALLALQTVGIPRWARGVRVQRAGFRQHEVRATEERGH